MIATPADPSFPAGSPQVGSRSAPHLSAGPIYIVGLDRSGKTTMRAFLASHSRIAIPAVGSNMWTYFYRRFGSLDQQQNLVRCLEAMARYKHVRFLDPDFDRIRREFAQGPATYARLFSLFLQHFAEEQGKPRWGVQSGLTEQYADELFVSLPGLKMVHMIRDPRDRYEASLAKWPEGRGRAGGATARWRFSARLAQRNEEKYFGHYLPVRFEDLVTETEKTVRKVCTFLGEPYEPQMLQMDDAPKLRRSLGDGEMTVDPEKLLSSEFIGGYRGRIPEPDLRFIQLHAGLLMRHYGYAEEPIDRSLSGRLRFGVRDWPNQAARMVAWRAAEEAHHRWPRTFGHEPGRRMIVDPAADNA